MAPGLSSLTWMNYKHSSPSHSMCECSHSVEAGARVLTYMQPKVTRSINYMTGQPMGSSLLESHSSTRLHMGSLQRPPPPEAVTMTPSIGR